MKKCIILALMTVALAGCVTDHKADRQILLSSMYQDMCLVELGATNHLSEIDFVKQSIQNLYEDYK